MSFDFTAHEKQFENIDWDLPTKGVSIWHDVIDARKLRSVMNESSSMAFGDGYMGQATNSSSAIDALRLFLATHSKEEVERVKEALFLYLYRGRPPKFFPSKDDADLVAEMLCCSIEASPVAKSHRKLSRHNRWHADLMTKIFFNEILSSIPVIEIAVAAKSVVESDDEEEEEGGPSDRMTGNIPEGMQSKVDEALSKAQEFTSEKHGNHSQSIDDMMEDMSTGASEDAERSPFRLVGMGLVDASAVSEKMGRLRQVLTREQANKIMRAPGATIGISHGNSLSLMLPTEAASLLDPDLELLFYKKFVDRALLQRKTEGIDRGGDGPIIFCMDVSGSMTPLLLEWTFALGGAIGFAAAKRGRDVAYVYYSDKIHDVIHVDYKHRRDLNTLTKHINSIASNMEWQTGTPHPLSVAKQCGVTIPVAGVGGGTLYSCALDAALKLYTSHGRWSNADILFLSDGHDSNPEKGKRSAKALQDRGVRVFGVSLMPAQVRSTGPLEFVAQSMGYFDGFVPAKVSEDSGAEDVVALIGSSL